MSLKLSEAIRLGAMLRPQAVGTCFTFSDAGELFSTCALAAGCEAAGWGHTGKELFGFLDTHFPIVRECVPHPLIHDNVFCLRAIIIQLNDKCGWSRERIADWVETVEAQHPELNPAPAPVEPTHQVAMAAK